VTASSVECPEMSVAVWVRNTKPMIVSTHPEGPCSSKNTVQSHTAAVEQIKAWLRFAVELAFGILCLLFMLQMSYLAYTVSILSES
jgi:hypothetical protein